MSHIQTIPPVTTTPLTTALLRQYATACTTALFVVIAVTGLLLFFHLQSGLVKAAHEWLSLLFVAASAFHVIRNWGAFTCLLKKTRTWAVVVVTLTITGIFVTMSGSTGNGGGSPFRQVTHAIEQAPLSAVAPVLGQPVDQMIVNLRSAGFAVSSANDSLLDIAAAKGSKSEDLLRIVLPKANNPR